MTRAAWPAQDLSGAERYVLRWQDEYIKDMNWKTLAVDAADEFNRRYGQGNADRLQEFLLHWIKEHGIPYRRAPAFLAEVEALVETELQLLEQLMLLSRSEQQDLVWRICRLASENAAKESGSRSESFGLKPEPVMCRAALFQRIPPRISRHPITRSKRRTRVRGRRRRHAR